MKNRSREWAARLKKKESASVPLSCNNCSTTFASNCDFEKLRRPRHVGHPPHQRQDGVRRQRPQFAGGRLHRRRREGRAVGSDVGDGDEDRVDVGHHLVDPVQLEFPPRHQRQQRGGEDGQAGSLQALTRGATAGHKVRQKPKLEPSL